MSGVPNHRDDTLVTVTGASGFIATHCILQLLQAGYRVRGTVRSRKRCSEIEEGLGNVVDVSGRLEFVEADLLSNEGWAQAVQGARFVLHVASPLPTAPPKDPYELITPAREGALRVLRAASEAQVERVVLTSSIAAITSGHERTDERVFDESEWSDLTRPMGAYEKSKTLAERAAWDFVEGLPPEKLLQLVTINPGLVLGPALIKDTSMSTEIIGKLLRRDIPGNPDLYLCPVDVRDVAAAHLRAMTEEKAVGQRFIVAGPNTSMQDVARRLQREFGPRGYRVPTRKLPNFLIRLVARFDKAVGLIVPELSKPMHVSSEKAEKLLGFSPISLDTTIAETGESLIRHGLA